MSCYNPHINLLHLSTMLFTTTKNSTSFTVIFNTMEYLGSIKVLLLAILVIMVISVRGQVSTPCTTSVFTNFTPCFNYLTGSTGNGSSPIGDCCNAFRSLTDTNRDCICLVLTANVPLQLPIINQTLALNLPRACNMAGVPLQCKASGSPLQAPGPVQLGPTPPPTAEAPSSPQASKAAAVLGPAQAPADQTVTSAPSPVEPEAETPSTTATPRIRPVFNPTSSKSSCISASSSQALIMFLAVVAMFWV